MVFYQVLILIAVVMIICVLAYGFRIKNRMALLIVILVVASAGAGGFCLVQYIFSSHFYNQNINVSYLQKLKFSSTQQDEIEELLPDYTPLSDLDIIVDNAYRKKMTIKKDGATSVIESTIYQFDSNKAAEQFFIVSQRFYDSKNFLPAESKLSLTKKGIRHRYMTSYIKSYYPDYKDIIYLPSKIKYQSEVMVMDNNMVVFVLETSNKPVSCKNEVIADMISRLNASA
jgi:hypothetical protein